MLMEELISFKKIYDEEPIEKNEILSPEVVFFADESGYANLFSQSPHLKGITKTRTAMGITGVPFDSCMVEDADSILKKYKAAVFLMPIPSEAGKHAMSLCDKMGIPYISATSDHYELTSDEIRGFYQKNGIHIYAEKNDVVYVGNGYVGYHSAHKGKKRLVLPETYTVTSVFGATIPSRITDTLEFDLNENATALFSISNKN